MSEIMTTVSYWTAALFLVVLYIALLADIFPRLFLKLRCAVKENLGRGLKKYVFPTGRAVLYEPHPTVRKYLNKYLLFTNDGYKYLRCSFDFCVSKITYTVIMLDNKDKVIDVLSVTEDMRHVRASANVRLHSSTSYVAIVVNRVNGAVNDGLSVYNKLRDIVFYFISVVLATSAAMFGVAKILPKVADTPFGTITENGMGVGIFFVFGAVIGVVCVFFYLMGASRKGIKVIVNEQK